MTLLDAAEEILRLRQELREIKELANSVLRENAGFREQHRQWVRIVAELEIDRDHWRTTALMKG